ncbi:hypothetical protein [Rothia sp. ZJ932]|uniref:hypothetical protein n=1 Tax=Rothia sp. ZJ932 TaxID=2810516 RepID=UPI00196869B0|nr:hypothetical protein [Rothia sp. ZJ932]QRZ61791.1 hypothetical protein JR346_01215 [Rothia sp. ZJ932]
MMPEVLKQFINGAFDSWLGKALGWLVNMMYSWASEINHFLMTWWMGLKPLGSGPGSTLEHAQHLTAFMIPLVGIAATSVALVKAGKGGREDVEQISGGLLRMLFVSAASIGGTSLLMAFSSELAPWIFEGMTVGAGDDARLMGASVEFSIESMAGGFYLLMLPFTLLASVVQACMAVGTDIAAGVLSAMLPITAAASVNVKGQEAFSKQLGWILACVSFKPVAALLYGIGVALIEGGTFIPSVVEGADGDTAGPVVTGVIGFMTIVAACFSLPALVKLIHPSPSVLGSGGSRFMSAVGGVATGAMMTKLSSSGGSVTSSSSGGSSSGGSASGASMTAGSSGAGAGAAGAGGSAAAGAAGGPVGMAAAAALSAGKEGVKKIADGAKAVGKAVKDGAIGSRDAGAGGAKEAVEPAAGGSSSGGSSGAAGGGADEPTKVLPELPAESAGGSSADSGSASTAPQGTASSSAGGADEPTKVLPELPAEPAGGSSADSGSASTAPQGTASSSAGGADEPTKVLPELPAEPAGGSSADSGSASTAPQGTASSSAGAADEPTKVLPELPAEPAGGSSADSGSASTTPQGANTSPTPASNNPAPKGAGASWGKENKPSKPTPNKKTKTASPTGASSSQGSRRASPQETAFHVQNLVRALADETAEGINPEGADH